MIQIYGPGNTDYFHNGDTVLLPSAATVHPILNGAWEASLEHSIDQGGRWRQIVNGAVVKMPSFNGDQLFRVKQVEKMDSGVSATMEPIFMDAMDDCFLVDVRPTNQNGQQALNLMTAPNAKYSASSNITKVSTAYYQFKNLIEAINGGDDNSFVNRWGGEILFNNYQVVINERVGGDYGVELRYGKNIPVDGLTEDADIRDVVTRIYPKAYNGHTMTNNGYVDSPLIESYPTVKARTITFSDIKMREDAQEGDEENGVIVCDTQSELDAALTQRCNEQYNAGLDKPTVSISADMVLLSNTEQYKDYSVLEEVSLGDTVHCINNHLGIVTDARVIELEYDCIHKRVLSVELGDFRYNYFNDVSASVSRIDSVIRADGTIMADKIAGFINGIAAQLRIQSTVAEKVDGIAFRVEDLDPNSPTYGCMVWGTQGIQISRQRTADGKDWDWTTAMTASGLMAQIIVAGILSDKLGNFHLNLDTGELIMKNGTFTGTVKGADISGSNISGTNMSGGTITGSVIRSGRNEAQGNFWVEVNNGRFSWGFADSEAGSLSAFWTSNGAEGVLRSNDEFYFDIPIIYVKTGQNAFGAAQTDEIEINDQNGDPIILLFQNGFYMGTRRT